MKAVERSQEWASAKHGEGERQYVDLALLVDALSGLSISVVTVGRPSSVAWGHLTLHRRS
jgi:hypothetical protein